MLAFSLAVILPIDGSAQAKKAQTINTVVQGTIASTGGAFTGLFTITGFAVQNGVLNAIGTLSGTVLNADGSTVGNVTQMVTIPVAGVDPSCQILNLTLGPLDLNLLGLMVHLNQVVLNITAQPGAGNLLGNLLCDVANLLNGGGPISSLLTQLSTLLNQILAAL